MGAARRLGCLLFAAVLPFAAYFSYVSFFCTHPCGRFGALFESVAYLLGDTDATYHTLDPEKRGCLWTVGEKMTMPHNRLSYLHALKTMLTEVQSRYSQIWQDSQSWWLEREVEGFLQVPHAQFVSTGTAALVVALQALAIGPGDEVLVPTYTWIATAASVMTTGAIPILVDVDETLGMSPEHMLAAITNRTKAVIAVHLRGVPCNIVAIKKVADSKGLRLIEDNAQSFGSMIGGKMAGTFGDMGITSVNPSKNFQAAGQGGLVWVSRPNETLIARTTWAVENGISVWGGIDHIPSYKRSFAEAGKAAEPAAEIPFGGHCVRAPSEWHAAFLRNELRQLPHSLAWLRQLKKTFIRRLDCQDVLQRVQDEDGDNSFFIVFILRSKEHAEMLRDYLASQGVGSDNSWWAMHYLPNVQTIMQKVSYHSSGFPWMTEEDQKPLEPSQFDRSTAILNRTLTIPNSWLFTKGMMEFAADQVNIFLRNQGYCQSPTKVSE